MKKRAERQSILSPKDAVQVTGRSAGRGGCNEPELVTGGPETLRALAGNESLFLGMSALGTRNRGLEKRQSWTIRNLWIYKLLDDLDRNLF